MQAGRPCSLLTRPLQSAAACGHRRAAAGTAGCRNKQPHNTAAVSCSHSHLTAAARADGVLCAGSNSTCSCRRSRLACSCLPPHAGATWATAGAAADPAAPGSSSRSSSNGAEAPASRVVGDQCSSDAQPAQAAAPPADGLAAGPGMNGSSSSSKSAKAVLQPVTYSMGYSLPPQANWQSAVAALQVRRRAPVLLLLAICWGEVVCT